MPEGKARRLTYFALWLKIVVDEASRLTPSNSKNPAVPFDA
jgi:hypothetical protein